MEYVVDNKVVNLDLNGTTPVGRGSCANVYLVNGEAYKIYKPSFCFELMSEEVVDRLKDISTKRIILPRTSVLDIEGNFCGMVSKYIEDNGIDDFLELDKDRVVDSFKYLEEDAIVLGEKKVIIYDLNYRNTVFNNGIYSIDFGRFLVSNKENVEDLIISHNIDSVNQYFVDCIMKKCCTDEIRGNFSLLRNEYYTQIKKGISFSDYLKEDMKDENVFEYVKRKAK